MKYSKYLLIIIFIQLGCIENDKVDRRMEYQDDFIDIKNQDSYSLSESISLLKKANKDLAEVLEPCYQDAKQINDLTKDMLSKLDAIYMTFVNTGGGIDPETGLLAERNNIEVTERFFLEYNNGKNIINELNNYFQKLEELGLLIKIQQRFYEHWKNKVTFDQYLFQHEKPKRVAEILNRIKLRVLIEVNQYLIMKLNDC
jgi:gliding motility-associated GldM-like protein